MSLRPPFQLISLHIPFHVLLFNGVALVVLALTFCKGDVQLCKAVLGNEKAGCHYCETLLLGGALQLAELLAVKEQLAVAAGVMGIVGAPPVLGYVHVLYVQLIPHKIAVAVYQRGLAGSDRFDLGTCKDDSCGIVVQELVLKRGPFVFYLYFTFCFRHNSANVVKKTNFVRL